MWRTKVLLILVLVYSHLLEALPQQAPDSFVTAATGPPNNAAVSSTTGSSAKPQVYSLNLRTDIRSRYARTLVTSRIANPADKAQEVTFQVTIPESAFVSKFIMEVDGEMMEGVVRERVQAKQEYHHAVQSGQTAGHVATASVRDSSHVRISVNVAAHSKASFNLTYEELLIRRKGYYELAINLNPGQLVREMSVDVYIQEIMNITELKIPAFRSSNEIDFNAAETVNEEAVVEWVSGHQVHVKFAPTLESQRRLGAAAGSEDKGLGGQFIVRYDVQRENSAGEVLALDGYFVHFFAPPELTPLPKHVVFVLDVSGSMHGRKIEQLREAMDSILRELRPGDYFNLIEFSYSVTIMDLEAPSNSTVLSPEQVPPDIEKPKPLTELPSQVKSFPANEEFITKARDAVKKMSAGGGTNIHDAVRAALGVASKAVDYNETDVKLPEPIIIFLTDGEATVGETRSDRILTLIEEQSSVPIFSLAFGQDADLPFLKRLSLRAGAFARKIYEAADAALQLQDFYRQVASPLLSNVTFNYLDTQVDGSSVTKQKFGLLFSGSELVVAGKLRDVNIQSQDLQLGGEVRGVGQAGIAAFPLMPPIDHDEFLPRPGRPHISATPSPQPGDRFLERLWAFLSIRQLLEQYDAERADERPGEPHETTTTPPSAAQIARSKALELALKFSFVTPVTSLIVVKSAVNTSTTASTPTGGSTTTPTPLALQFGEPIPVDGSHSSLYLSASRPVGGFGVAFAGAPGPSSGLSSTSFGSPGPRPAYLAGNPGLPGRPGNQPTTTRPSRPSYPPPPLPPTQEESISKVESALESTATTESVKSTTTSIITPQENLAYNFTRVTMEALTWLQILETDISTPEWRSVHVANSSETYKLLYSNQSALVGDLVNCEPPTVTQSEWKCYPLTDCILAEFADNPESFLSTFKCAIGTEGYLGACCPVQSTESSSTQPGKPRPVAVEVQTEVAATVTESSTDVTPIAAQA